MVDFVRSSYTSRITVVGVTPYFKTLVNKDIVHHKVGQPIGKYTYANG
jgi:hypothetical protein